MNNHILLVVILVLAICFKIFSFGCCIRNAVKAYCITTIVLKTIVLRTYAQIENNLLKSQGINRIKLGGFNSRV